MQAGRHGSERHAGRQGRLCRTFPRYKTAHHCTVMHPPCLGKVRKLLSPGWLMAMRTTLPPSRSTNSSGERLRTIASYPCTTAPLHRPMAVTRRRTTVRPHECTTACIATHIATRTATQPRDCATTPPHTPCSYEGGSTIFGPHQLEAYTDQLLMLADHLAAGSTPPIGKVKGSGSIEDRTDKADSEESERSEEIDAIRVPRVWCCSPVV